MLVAVGPFIWFFLCFISSHDFLSGLNPKDMFSRAFSKTYTATAKSKAILWEHGPWSARGGAWLSGSWEAAMPVQHCRCPFRSFQIFISNSTNYWILAWGLELYRMKFLRLGCNVQTSPCLGLESDHMNRSSNHYMTRHTFRATGEVQSRVYL